MQINWIKLSQLCVTFSMPLGVLICTAGVASAATERSETFNADPAWDSRFNRRVPAIGAIVTQNFGIKNSSNAGGAAQELGGPIARTTTPAWFAEVLTTPKTMNDFLTASGKISAPNQTSVGGLNFGWFNSDLQGWRPWNSINFRLDGQGSYSETHVDYNTQTWNAGGQNATQANPAYTLPHDNSDHTWLLQYDPNANGGGGAVSFQLDSLPPVIRNLDPGHKAKGAVFDRFGLWNMQTPSGSINSPTVSSMSVYFDDVAHDGGAVQPFTTAGSSGWEGHGNATTFSDKELRRAHNFGFSNTNHAGGAGVGEIGGTVWRPIPDEEPYYGAKTEQTLTLNNRLTASGRVSLVRAQSDGGLYIGWFNKTSLENTVVGTNPQIAPMANFLAINLEGFSRDGHRVSPVLSTSGLVAAIRRYGQDGPIILPDGDSHAFTITYNPTGNGSITVTLDSLSTVFNLQASAKIEGALFDHFGIFSVTPDGKFVEAYFDDLTYTVAVPEPAAGTVMLLISLLGFGQRRSRARLDATYHE